MLSLKKISSKLFKIYLKKNKMSEHVPLILIVPRSIARRSLLLMVGIMSFLACLVVGGVSSLWDAAQLWRQDLLQEMTVQIRPLPEQDILAEIDKAVALLQEFPGVGSVRAVSNEETEQILKPWLGEGLALEALPLPRLISVESADPAAIDLEALRLTLKKTIQGGTLDDHKIWIKHLTRMANGGVLIGVVLFFLMLVATVLSVIFATRAAMADNHKVVAVLHFVGAEPRYISRQFQRDFGLLGLKGGGVGGGLALGIFLALPFFTHKTALAEAQATSLLGTFSVGASGITGAVFVIILVSLLTALTSRFAVESYLKHVE